MIKKEDYSKIIKKKLKDIFEYRFEIKEDSWTDDLMNKKLLGLDIGLYPSDMLYIFFDIESEFDITIPQEEIARGNFDSFNAILQVVERQLTEQASMVETTGY